MYSASSPQGERTPLPPTRTVHFLDSEVSIALYGNAVDLGSREWGERNIGEIAQRVWWRFALPLELRELYLPILSKFNGVVLGGGRFPIFSKVLCNDEKGRLLRPRQPCAGLFLKKKQAVS